MINAVADSGPFIHLAILNLSDLLQRYFHPILTVRGVYEEVVTQGEGRPGARELATACDSGIVHIVEVSDPRMIEALRQSRPSIPEVSEVDRTVVALAIGQQATLLSDDGSLRLLAQIYGLPLIGSVGVLIQARLDGVIPSLKPMLDRLIAVGFHLNPQGQVYRDALRKVGEVES